MHWNPMELKATVEPETILNMISLTFKVTNGPKDDYSAIIPTPFTFPSL